MNKFFFELLQIAVGNSNVLTRPLTIEEWMSLYLLFKKQTLLGIGYVGITKLPKDQAPPIKMLAQWAHDAKAIELKNQKANGMCVKICAFLKHEGFGSCILKGQSNVPNYPKELKDYRTPGDIDVLCWPLKHVEITQENGSTIKYYGNRAVIEYILNRHRIEGSAMPEVQYHHVDWKCGNVPVEVHFRASWLNNPFSNRKLQRWTKDNRPVSLFPDASFNVIYQLVHINRHLFNEGIGLRQILDYYFALKAWKNSVDMNISSQKVLTKVQIMHTLRSFNMVGFASAVMHVLQNVFAMPSEYLLCPPDEKRGRFLLNEILIAGNFGKYDDRNEICENEGYLKRFVRRQKRFMRFLTQYPSEVVWGPYFSVKQRMWRMSHGWR